MSKLLLILFIWLVCLAVIPDLTKVITILFMGWVGIWTMIKIVFRV